MATFSFRQPLQSHRKRIKKAAFYFNLSSYSYVPMNTKNYFDY